MSVAVLTAEVVIAAARSEGFHRASVIPVEAPRRHELYRGWLEAGYHGEMAYLAAPEHIELRRDLRQLASEARTLVVVALAYHRVDPPTDGLVQLRGRIARYARGEDYHMELRDKLVRHADKLAAQLGAPVASRPCVDAAPVLEREFSERGALGFVAKNTMLIAPGLGSYVVLGELLLDVDVTHSDEVQASKPRCGSCRSCLDACPTGAFVDEYVLDARRCISYLTIEHRGSIPRELRAAIGTWIFGCDICQEVCPFNAGSGGKDEPAPELSARDLEHALPDLVAMATQPSNQLRRFVRRTSMRRASRDQILRNVAVALGNTGDARAVPALAHLVVHRSSMVREHAAWALGHLATQTTLRDDAHAALAAALVSETEQFVRDEITAALT